MLPVSRIIFIIAVVAINLERNILYIFMPQFAIFLGQYSEAYLILIPRYRGLSLDSSSVFLPAGLGGPQRCMYRGSFRI